MKKFIGYLSATLVSSLISLPTLAQSIECPSVAYLHGHSALLDSPRITDNGNYYVESSTLFFTNQHYWRLGAEIYADDKKTVSSTAAISYAKSAARHTNGIEEVSTNPTSQVCDYQVASSDKHTRYLWAYTDFDGQVPSLNTPMARR